MTFAATFQNGLTVIIEQRAGPGFALELCIPQGAAHDPAGAEGSAALLKEWLYKGAGNRNTRELADAFDSLGLEYSSSVSYDTTRLSVSGLASDLAVAVTLTADLIQRPLLPDSEFSVLVDLARQDLDSIHENPAEQLQFQIQQKAFDAPYSHSVLGHTSSLERIKAGQVKTHFEKYGPQGAVLVVVSPLEIATVRHFITQHFENWTSKQPSLFTPLTPLSKWPEVKFRANQTWHETCDTNQVQLGLIFAGPGPLHPDWLLFHLALGVLSGTPTARLFDAVREQRGLAYSVGASSWRLGRAGFTWASASSTPQHAGQTLEVILSEFSQIRTGVSQAEFERARTALVTGMVFGAESSSERATTLTRYWHLYQKVHSLKERRTTLAALQLSDLNTFLENNLFEQPTIMTLGPVCS